MITIPGATVNSYAAQLRAKWQAVSGAAARVDKAAELLIAGGLTDDAGSFFILSSRADGTGYRLDGNDCPCADYANGAPRLGSAKFCKHKIAVAMMKRFIRESAQPRILNGENAPTLRHMKRQLKGGPLIYLHRQSDNTLTDWQRLFIRTRWNDSIFGNAPASDADYIALARWLEDASPLPAPKSIFDAWTTDASANDAAIMPFGEWRQLYGHLYADPRR